LDLLRLPASRRHLQGRQVTQAALTHVPAHASVSLAQGLRYDPSLENMRNFHNVVLSQD